MIIVAEKDEIMEYIIDKVYLTEQNLYINFLITPDHEWIPIGELLHVCIDNRSYSFIVSRQESILDTKNLLVEAWECSQGKNVLYNKTNPIILLGKKLKIMKDISLRNAIHKRIFEQYDPYMHGPTPVNKANIQF